MAALYRDLIGVVDVMLVYIGECEYVLYDVFCLFGGFQILLFLCPSISDIINTSILILI